ncbi:MAG: YeeE/YedE thiosulfate transporter family protein [Alcanivorax sp.]|uniref:YeeE/YedE thiosulfate transporter family protein n=1 Tax=Alcanivorax sp. TaxID=1872427 RepID=UPI003DA6E6E5
MYWNWKVGGPILGLTFLLAVALVKPIGVSTQFVILDAMVADWFNPALVVTDSNSSSGYASSNAYLDKSGGKYAKAAANPLNYSFVFVLSMVLGGFLGRLFQRAGKAPKIRQIPDFHEQQFGPHPMQRYLLAFGSGILVLWGARLAGGCTSGHMMSGMMQTAISGYLFAAAAFATAIPTAMLLYRREGGSWN